MIRIVCPFCHSPLNASDLETATLGDRVCLVCPECEHVLLMDDDVVDGGRCDLCGLGVRRVLSDGGGSASGGQRDAALQPV